MKIVVASRSTLGHHLGGMETYVDSQVDALKSFGHDVILLTSPGVSQGYLCRLTDAGIAVEYVTGSNPRRYTAVWHQQIQCAVAKLQPDSVIFHGVAGCSYTPNSKTSAISLTHGSAPISIYNSLRGHRPIRSVASRALSFFRQKEAFQLRRHELVALSHFDARLTALATLQPKSRVAVIPPAISLRPQVAQREKLVIYAGRIELIKGVEQILNSWRRVDSKGYRLIVAGDGSQLARLRDEFEEVNRVAFIGAVSREELADLLARARWSVSGGRFMESFGLSVAESLASGTPVVYPRRGALPETVGTAGISYRREKDLSHALQSAVDVTESDWSDLHDRARVRAMDFSPERSLHQWDRLLSGTT